MDKLEGKTLDITECNIEKIKRIFPNIVVDGKIDFDRLRLILGDEVDSSSEKYQFNWVGKNNTIRFAQAPSTATLLPVKKASVNWEETNNMYIEGDNVEVLKLLQKTYYGKIKAIYIDPPYNTGGDFVYKDDFKDSVSNYLEITAQTCKANPNTSGRFHTDWLNMMYSRLYLAKNLLTNDGIIFISIDDHEQVNLRKICDEIFGESNFVATLKWKKKKQPSFLSKVADVMEYIHVYAKNYEMINQLCVEKLSDSDKPVVNASNNMVERTIKAGIRVKADVDFIKKGLYQNKTMSVEFLDDVYVSLGRTTNSFRCIAKFRTNQEMIDEFCDLDLLFITKNLGFRRDLTNDEKGSGKAITDLLLDWGQNQDATNEVKKLFDLTNDYNIFSNPKPVLLVKNLIKSISNDDDIILDFFSGSGTTAQAVMELNSEDGHQRKFILVQLPEKIDENEHAYALGYRNICEIGEERIRRAFTKIYNEQKEKYNSSGLLIDEIVNPDTLDLGFKVFKLETTNIRPWDGNIKIDEQTLFDFTDTIKEDRTNLDVAYEIMLKYGIFNMPLKEVQINDKTMYNIGDGYMIICLDNEINTDDITEIAKQKPHCVVFKEKGFEDDNVKINATYTLERLGVEDVKCI